MTSILQEGQLCYLTHLPPSANRKLEYRWELAQVGDTLVTVNTQIANKVARCLLEENQELKSLLGIDTSTRLVSEISLESSTNGPGTRFDFALLTSERPILYIEVKQVTLRLDSPDGRSWAAFPDAVTARGKKHLQELIRLQHSGQRTALLYIVGRSDVSAVRPAHEVDPAYGLLLQQARSSGVTLLAAGLEADKHGITFKKWLPVNVS